MKLAFRSLVLLAFIGCSKHDDAPAPAPELPVVACDSAKAFDAYEDVELGDIEVHLDATGAHPDLLASDLAAQLKLLWGASPVIQRDAPASTSKHVIWISDSAAAKARVSGTDQPGYVLKRDGNALIAYASDPRDLAHGAYALLEKLGLRFFHPKQTFAPKLAKPKWPRTLDLVRTPAFASRSIQIHTLHPLEWTPALTEPGDAHLADAKTLIDWLVRTGHNELQWYPLGSVPLDDWRPHAKKIIEYAHLRGVAVTALVQMWGGSSLQNAYALVNDKSIWQTQMDQKLTDLFDVPFDGVELALGEFLATDFESVVTWMDHATATVNDKWPGRRVSISNHVGNYPDLYRDFRGDKNVFFYFLPKYADPRLTTDVHTVYFFDLYRDWGGYNHPNFFAHRDFLFEQLGKRPVRYKPESAYWATADIDVPIFLPEYLQARWNDVHNLVADTQKKGLPPVEGHIMFSSGHEWGYWLTDYLTGKMLWEPQRDLASFIDEYATIYGDCRSSIGDSLRAYVDLQSKYLFDARLAPYLAAEDSHDDFGAKSNIVTIPPRVPFEALLSMDEAERTKLEADVVQKLDAFAAESDPLAASIAARCRGADASIRPWCDELRDGVDVVSLRARHAAALYRAVLAYARHAGDPAQHLADAKKLTEQAAAVIVGREKQYRFPADVIAAPRKNPTIYPFGYLYQAHVQCLWHRREEQVAWLLENGEPAPFGQISSCQE